MQLPSNPLKDKNNDFAYHKVKEAFDAGLYIAGNIDGTENPSYILIKSVIP